MKALYLTLIFVLSGHFSIHSQTSLEVDAGPCATVYYGYEPLECVDLSATITVSTTEPYSYLWSTGDTTSIITVCPDQPTVYFLTVTDSLGATAVDSVTIQAVDVRCGSSLEKIALCHLPPGNPSNPRQICIAASAVPAHIDPAYGHSGCYVGFCNQFDPCDGGGKDALIELFPNPAFGEFYVMLPSETLLESTNIEIYDVSGTLVKKIQPLQHNTHVKISSENRNSMYFVKVYSDRFFNIERVIVN